MKWLIFFAVCFFGLSLCAQSWEDSLRKGKKLYQEGKYDQSYNTLLEAQRMAPADVDLSKDVGNAAYRSGDYKTAKNAYKAAAAKEHSPEMRSKKWHNVGNSQMKEKDYAGAVESYKNALRADPSNEKARYNLAEAKRRLKQQQEKEKQQNKNQDQKSKDQENDNQDKKKNDNESKDGEPQDKDSQKDNSKPSDSQSSQEQASEKLSNKKSDRMLEELLKQEMETKKKVRGVNSKESKGEVESGKRW